MGGGGSKQKTVSETLTDVATNILTETIQKCGVSLNQSQEIVISGSYNVASDITMDQSFSINSSCTQDAKSMAEIQNKMAQAMTQKAEQLGDSVFGAIGGIVGSKSKQDVENHIKTSIKNEITARTVQDIIQTVNNVQSIRVSGDRNIIRNIAMTQIGKLISQNAQSAIQKTKLINDIKTKVDQEAKQTQENPFVGAIKGMWGGINQLMSADWNSVIIIVLILVIGMVVAAVIYAKMGGQLPKVGAGPSKRRSGLRSLFI
jgi:hypothetical protein